MALQIGTASLLEPTAETIGKIVAEARRGHLESVVNDSRVFTCETRNQGTNAEIVFRIQSFIFHSEIFMNCRLKIFRGSSGCVRFSLATTSQNLHLEDYLNTPSYLSIAEEYDVYRIYYRGRSLNVGRQE